MDAGARGGEAGEVSATLEVRVKRLTADAALLVYEGEEEWVALSLIDTDDVLREGEDAEVTIRSWKLREIGWE